MQDPDLADELESLSVDEYAERKGLQLSNPIGSGVIQLKQQEFLQQVKDTVKEAVKEARSNPGDTLAQPVSAALSVPTAPVTPTRRRTKRHSQRDEILDALKDIQAALDEDDVDGAQSIIDDVLSDPDYSEEGD
jgi:hypothetical protein